MEVFSADGGEVRSESWGGGGEDRSVEASGGLIAVMVLLHGGNTLIIRRPHVAKFMFICAARKKFLPKRKIRNKRSYIIHINILRLLCVGTF